MEKKTDSFKVVSKEIVLEVNAYKTKHNIMSLDQNARWIHYVQFHDSLFEGVVTF